MTSELLEKARKFEQEHLVPDQERPAYHMTGGCGWINDPNGFSVYKGEYHLFHQYHPYSNNWGPMHWGHMKSKDLITWERLPIIMAPDEAYDNAGCFSGSAVELADGRHLLMYTGVQEYKQEDGSSATRQVQCMAVGDGLNYEKYEGNPVITPDSLSQGGIPSDFRDPKFWQDEDGCFYSIIANMRKDGNGQAVLYKSEDGFHWEYASLLDESDGKLGKMWECPDFFPLDEKQVLVISPMAMKPEEGKFHVGHGTVALIGEYDKKTCQFQRESAQPIDWGIDFYAPQSLLTEDGRRVMIAWMQDWSNSNFVPEGVHYFGQLTIPRELSLRDGVLYQAPVRELEAYRGELTSYEQVSVSEKMELDGIKGRVLDMTVTVKNSSELEDFTMNFAADEEYHTTVCYDAKKNTLCMDRSFGGYLYDIVHRREFPLQTKGAELKLRFLLDKYSMEIFINDGEQTASLTMYTPLEADGITFEAKGTAEISVEKYELKF